ncbi:hypothetical protein M441DRAFT_154551 [Trichoderma asperellum CBS 433.97]|uniref:Uncharacterized protein n=1 Tax=Trichoderma asperellum (strain ATCC 204424 / CBS 433.97 / NBRC 101777) TaxID=1042311 RepID=A0A2T3YQU9_TRIA4|nr:hypothetical protein M441DRAFT_154551 [Trichoderma asperellum CBS 433.97]PTB34938.1 hypothetical protein M441DRAFT_154551 [Trichoderma asperellum CBS 433.97]
MTLQTLLELKANAPGLPGPYLQENLAPYRAIDVLGTKTLQVVTVIGGLQKRATLLRYFGLSRQSAPGYSVALCPWPGNSDKIFLDCELHLQPDSAINKIVGGFQPGHLHYHLLQHPPHKALGVAYSFYYNVLSLFSDLIVLFVSDTGGLKRVINILCYWMQEGLERRHQHRAYISLVFGEGNEIRDEVVMGRLEIAMLYRLRTMNTQTDYTLAQIQQTRKRLFNISIIRHTKNLVSAIDKALLAGTIYRAEAGLNFSAINWKLLFQEATVHYGKQKYSHFNVISASRLHYPVPKHLSACIMDVFRSCEESHEIPYIIASALAMDAFPPRMQSFPPDQVFETLYREAVHQCEKNAKIPNVTLKIKLFFSTLELEPWRFKHTPCRVCSSNNVTIIKLKPPTAGNRILHLRLLQAVSNQLLCHLFYIELKTMPMFYYSPEVITIVIRCRLNPGHALLDLLFRIHRLRICFYYQCDEITEMKALVCTEDVIQKCREMQPFERKFKIKVLSPTAAISIDMDGIDGEKYSISNCPYRVDHLIEDQGLNNPYRRTALQIDRNKDSLQSKPILQLEVAKTIDTLELLV